MILQKILLMLFLFFVGCMPKSKRDPSRIQIVQDPSYAVQLPKLTIGGDAKEILYGRELIIHTSYFLGKNGKVASLLTNGVQCQHCHLDGGTRLYGNHLLNAYAKYPNYEAKLGKKISVAERINLCIDESYQGKKLSLSSREMKAIVAYLKWLSLAKIEVTPKNTTTFLIFDPPARKLSLKRGKKIYTQHCERCHKADGRGEREPDSDALLFPPLWGSESYNTASSFFRNFLLAQFIRANMPYGALWENPVLSEEEALDVAGYINSKARPKHGKTHYPKLAEKPYDYPFGPYADSDTELSHRFGPFKLPIEKKRK